MVSKVFGAVLNVGATVTAMVALSVCTLAIPLEAHAQKAAISVEVRPASELFVYPMRQATASVLPQNQSRISAQVSAPVLEVLVDAGSKVAAGDVLARLEKADFQLLLDQARARHDGLQARLRLGLRQLKRLRELKTNNFVSTEAVNQRDAEVVGLRADLKGSKAQVAAAIRQLQKCTIRAPFDAAVAVRTAQVGELTSPGTPLFTLTQLGNEEISAAVSLADADTLSSVRSFKLRAGGRESMLRLKRVSPVVSPRTRTREARFAFTAAGVASGSQGAVVWPDSRPHIAPTVLVRRAGQSGVFIVRNNKARFVAIVGAQEGRPALAQNIPAATAVIVSGQDQLQSGQAVTVVRK